MVIKHVMLRIGLAVLQLVAVGISGVRAHGYLAAPPSRNFIANSDYCPQCLSAGGPFEVYGGSVPVKKPGKYGVCGDPWAGPRNHEVGGKFYPSPPNPPPTTLRAGSVFVARVKFTATHLGRWGLRVCRLPTPSAASERATLSQACFDRVQLQRADGAGLYAYVGPGTSEQFISFKLPAYLTCGRCVMQWHYETGNSCTPEGTPPRFANTGLEKCFTERAAAPEEFWNCADVRITKTKKKVFKNT